MSKLIELKEEYFANSYATKEVMIEKARVLITDKGSCGDIACGVCFLSYDNNNQSLCRTCRPDIAYNTVEYYEAKEANKAAYAKAFLKLFDKLTPTKIDLTQ